MVAALFIVIAGGNITELIGAKLALGKVAVIAWKILQWPVALSFIILAFALIYYFGPDLEEQHWYWITPGSLVGVLLWLAAFLVSAFTFTSSITQQELRVFGCGHHFAVVDLCHGPCVLDRR